MGKQDARAAQLIARLPEGELGEHHYDSRDASYIKAELIRRNLLSRKDLMQLYRPPLKKSQMPENNPFTAKTMVSRDYNPNIIRLPKAGPSGKLNGALVPLVPLVSYSAATAKLPSFPGAQSLKLLPDKQRPTIASGLI